MIKLLFYDFCNVCKDEYPDYEFIYGHVNMCIDCYCKLTKKRLGVVNSIKNFYKRINDIGGYVVGEYINNHTSVDCICSKNHCCTTIPSWIQQGHGMCRICTRRDPKTAEQNFHDNIKRLGGKVIGKYIKSGIGVDCICSKNHCCTPTPNWIQQGGGMCRICAGQDPETAEQNFHDNIKKLGGTVIGKYTYSDIGVDCICSKNHCCTPIPNWIQHGGGMCRICVGHDSETAEQNFYDNIHDQGGTVIGKYINSYTSVECICSKNHCCTPTPTSIQHGGGMCGRCCFNGYSKISIKWLNSISNDIQHAENKGEFKIPNIGKVDGYNHKTNTVYEFHGCFWHGCQKCYKSDYVNPINYTKASDLYSKTIERSLAIRNDGYNLVEIWKCDFKEN